MAGQRPPFGPLQVQPAGFLGLLQLKSQGYVPSTVPDSVQPTIEFGEWIFATQSEVVAGQHQMNVNSGSMSRGNFYGFSVTPGNAAIEVPAGEWWYVHNYSVRLGSVTTGDAVIRLAYLDPPFGSGFSAFFLSAPNNDMHPNGNRNGMYATNFWLRPGSELVIFVDAIGTADYLIVGSACVTRLPI